MAEKFTILCVLNAFVGWRRKSRIFLHNSRQLCVEFIDTEEFAPCGQGNTRALFKEKQTRLGELSDLDHFPEEIRGYFQTFTTQTLGIEAQ